MQNRIKLYRAMVEKKGVAEADRWLTTEYGAARGHLMVGPCPGYGCIMPMKP